MGKANVPPRMALFICKPKHTIPCICCPCMPRHRARTCCWQHLTAVKISLVYANGNPKKHPQTASSASNTSSNDGGWRMRTVWNAKQQSSFQLKGGRTTWGSRLPDFVDSASCRSSRLLGIPLQKVEGEAHGNLCADNFAASCPTPNWCSNDPVKHGKQLQISVRSILPQGVARVFCWGSWTINEKFCLMKQSYVPVFSTIKA